jgi:hypothetical protein
MKRHPRPAGPPCFDSPLGRFFLLLATTSFLLSVPGAATPINPPLGPHVPPGPDEFAAATSFTAQDRVVLTSYFYWYDVYSGAHLTNADGSDALTDHPPTLTGFSYKSAAWHRQQLLDMIDAGIDVLLPVYWGEPSQRLPGVPVAGQPWSFAGLPPLVTARAELVAEGKQPPRIGLFYDTSTLEYNAAGRRIDLTTDHGRRWFYESIRDFFSLIPARDWAMIEGRPIVFLYAAGFAAAHDQTCIDYVRQEFARDFSGRDPYIVREVSWNVRADNTYAWGGAISLKNPGVGALGPGYDHSAVPGREPLIVPRENGAFFERNWVRFLRRPSNLVHIETWNEYHEGTDIAASREYGRQYLELNRKFVDLFKAGVKPPRPTGPFSDARSIRVRLGPTNEVRGLTQFEFADGATRPAEAAGSPCRETAPTVHAGRYVYFQIDDSFKWADDMLVDVAVEYFDAGSGTFRVEYDGPDPNAPFNGAYTSSPTQVTLGESGQWKLAKFRLLEARFLNSQNGGADFRIAVQAPSLKLRLVTVSRQGVPAEAGQPRRGWQQDFGEPLDAAWVRGGATGDLFRATDGLLRVEPSPAGPAWLTAAVPGEGLVEAEVLARLRVVEPSDVGGALGGVALGVDGTAGTGFACRFRSGTAGVRGLEWAGWDGTPGPVATFAWQPNRWYWLRARHEPRPLTGGADLLARLWLADGETPEPAGWLVWWDYYPATTARRGFAGLATGMSPAAIEYDYWLLQADGLPEIPVRLPALKPARPELEPVGWSPATGLTLRLHGTADTTYAIDRSADLARWDEHVVVTDAAGRASFVDLTATHPPHRFYRGRVLPVRPRSASGREPTRTSVGTGPALRWGHNHSVG